MRILFLAVLAVVAVSGPAFAADDRSPYDRNPACLDPKVDASKGDCVIQDSGTPRHKYPPKTTSSVSAKPATSTAAPAAAGREAAPAAARKGG